MTRFKTYLDRNLVPSIAYVRDRIAVVESETFETFTYSVGLERSIFDQKPEGYLPLPINPLNGMDLSSYNGFIATLPHLHLPHTVLTCPLACDSVIEPGIYSIRAACSGIRYSKIFLLQSLA